MSSLGTELEAWMTVAVWVAPAAFPKQNSRRDAGCLPRKNCYCVRRYSAWF